MARLDGSDSPAGNGRPPASWGRTSGCTRRSRREGSQTSIRDSQPCSSPQSHHMLPPARGVTRAPSGNQRTNSSAFVSARHTSSGVAARSSAISKARRCSTRTVFSMGSSFGGRRMHRRENPEAASAGRALVVVLGGEVGDGVGQLAGELRPLFRVGEPHVGVERKGGDALAFGSGLRLERADVADDPSGGGQQVGAAEPIRRGLGAGAEHTERFGADDERPGGGAEHPLEAVALPPLFHQCDQACILEGTQVIVEPRARKPESPRQPGSGVGLCEMGEELLPHWIECGDGGLWPSDDLERGGRHGSTLAPTTYLVKTTFDVGYCPLSTATTPITPSITPMPILIPTAAARPSTAPQPARAAPWAWRARVYSKTVAPMNAPTNPPITDPTIGSGTPTTAPTSPPTKAPP